MRLISPPTAAKRLRRTLRNLPVTTVCFFLTVLVLRGSLGAGRFGTPAQDFQEIRHQFQSLRRSSNARRALFHTAQADSPRPYYSEDAHSFLKRAALRDGYETPLSRCLAACNWNPVAVRLLLESHHHPSKVDGGDIYSSGADASPAVALAASLRKQISDARGRGIWRRRDADMSSEEIRLRPNYEGGNAVVDNEKTRGRNCELLRHANDDACLRHCFCGNERGHHA